MSSSKEVLIHEVMDRGVNLLDDMIGPSWVHLVDLDALDESSIQQDVISQVARDSGDQMWHDVWRSIGGDDEACDYGFDISTDMLHPTYGVDKDEWTVLWKYHIMRLRRYRIRSTEPMTLTAKHFRKSINDLKREVNELRHEVNAQKTT